ncbi:pre-mRNA-splicing factor CWC22 -like protein [Brachionus plicatilis]|uniref:Pre-mRNA-splicing factor CWC22-like protein n=1 Tax=Brachionus plicatilis TaxID=10195 RepID=A0A3M7QRL4_BRAPC|nr:pre-mRNA-splicing factor CWC22 -like protein [Brachionus plicatilis]
MSTESTNLDSPEAKKQQSVIKSTSIGVYVPPAKLKLLQEAISDKSGAEYQRLSWEALKKSIHGLVNKINIPNISQVVRELFKENIIRGRGLLCRSVMQAQLFSPTFTNVYSSLMAIINMKFPQIGELLLRRLIIQFKTSYKQNRKEQCISTCRFIAHLINQNVAHEILALQILTLLLENPTNHSVEVAIGLLKECGKKLSMESPKSLHALFESLRNILNEQNEMVDDKRIQYMIEVMFAIRKDDFKDYPVVLKELDLVEESEQYTHFLSLDDEDLDVQSGLNIFKYDVDYEENEKKYNILKREILDESDSDESGSSDGEDSGDEQEEPENEETEEKKEDDQMIIDETETNLVALRRTIYLTIQSSLDFQECAHKLLKMNIKKNQEMELCQMILDSCAQQRTYERFFGLLAQRFCELKKEYVEHFEEIFKQQYETCHRLETVKLRNVSKLLSHLLYTDSISWGVFECVHLNEDETTSSSRVFLKNLLLDLSEHLGIVKLKERFSDLTLQEFFAGLFPRDNPRHTRFSINFFTSIGLGALTDDLREHLKSAPKLMQPMVLDNSDLDKSRSDKEEKKRFNFYYFGNPSFSKEITFQSDNDSICLLTFRTLTEIDTPNLK